MLLSEAWTKAIAEWELAQRASGAPSTTIGTRRQHLRRLGQHAGVVDPWAMTEDALVTWVGRQEWARETRRGHRNSYRAFYRWGHEKGRIDHNPALALPVVKPAQPRPRPAPDTIYQRALMRAPRREMLMLRLAAEIGMRRAEVAQAHSTDLIPDLGGWSLVVHGKGGRERVVPLPAGLAAELQALPKGYFFPGDDHGHLSARWVGKLVTNLLPEHWTMHTLRHRFATRAYAVERDVFAVQDLLGHASPATTRVYVAIPNDALRRTVDGAAAAS